MNENIEILKDIKSELGAIKNALITSETENKYTLDKIIEANNEDIKETQAKLAETSLNTLHELIRRLTVLDNIPSIYLIAILKWSYLQSKKNINTLAYTKLCQDYHLFDFLTKYPNAAGILVKIKENETRDIHVWEKFFHYIGKMKSENIDDIEKVLMEFSHDENVEL